MNVLVWDFDNTLAYRDGMWTRTLHHVLNTYGNMRVEEAALRPFLENGFPWHRHMESHASYFQGLSWWEYLYTVLAPAMTGNGVSNEDAEKLLPLVRETYLDVRYWQLFADTIRNLEKAVASGYTNHILSNHVPELRVIVAGLGIAKYFDRVITSADIGYEKPNAKAFQALLEQVEQSDSVCMIGDSYSADVLGALACGMDAILVRGNNSNGYARHADDLDGIWQYLPISGQTGSGRGRRMRESSREGRTSMVHQLVVGMPTLMECGTIEQNVALCKELGLQFIELNMNLPPYQLERIDPAYYRNLMTDHGIFFTLHLPEELNIADANWRVREAWMQTVMDAIALAKALQMPILNMHMSTGVYFTMPAQRIYLFESYREAYLKHIMSFRERVAEAIGEANLCLAIENTGVYGLGFITAAVEELLTQPCFGLTWDVGHDVVSGNQDAAFVTQHQHRFRHFHLHDVKNGKDHLPLGTGMVDLMQRLEMAKRQQYTCVLETKTIEGLRQSVAWMKKEVGCTTCDNG